MGGYQLSRWLKGGEVSRLPDAFCAFSTSFAASYALLLAGIGLVIAVPSHATSSASHASSAIGNGHALTVQNNSPHRIEDDWNVSGDVTFTGDPKPYATLPTYLPQRFTGGLRFVNGRENLVSNRFINAVQGMVLGVEGAHTVVRYGGAMQGDGNQSFTNLSLLDGGRFILTRDARLDFVNDGMYTRQIWVRSDGQGVFEVEDGFVADRTQNGTVADGIGSYRISKATLIIHEQKGLPQHRRGQGHNGHFVFEDQPGGRFIAAGKPLEYVGSFWAWVDCTIETRADFTHTGKLIVLKGAGIPDYELAAAFQTLSPDITITKEGPAALVLTGEQAYSPGAVLDIRAGSAVFACDAAGGWLRGSSAPSGQELKVKVSGGALAAFDAPRVRLKALEMAEQSRLRLGSEVQVDVSGTVQLNGILEVVAHSALKSGDKLALFRWNAPSGRFASLQLPAGLQWDTSKLYSEGSIQAISGTVATLQPLGGVGAHGGEGVGMRRLYGTVDGVSPVLSGLQGVWRLDGVRTSRSGFGGVHVMESKGLRPNPERKADF